MKYIDEDPYDGKVNKAVMKEKVNFRKMYSDKLKKLYVIFKEYEKTGFDEIDVDDVKEALVDPNFVNILTNGFSPTAPSMLMERILKNDKPLTFEEFSEIVLESRRISYDIAQQRHINDYLFDDNIYKKYYYYNYDKIEEKKVITKEEIINSCIFLFIYTALMILSYEIDRYTKYKYISNYGELQYYNFIPTMFLTYIFVHKSRMLLFLNIFHFSCVYITIQYYFKTEIKYIIIITISSVTYGSVIHLFEEINLSGSQNCTIGLLSLLFVNIIFNNRKNNETQIVPILLCIIFLSPMVLHPSASSVGGIIGGFCSSILIILKKKLINIPNDFNICHI
uniref:Rhomboid domain-containing protein n=1 Tax=Strongyloides papillosus TaxID=174720 RepID=A0A0N5CCG0_STREA